MFLPFIIKVNIFISVDFETWLWFVSLKLEDVMYMLLEMTFEKLILVFVYEAELVAYFWSWISKWNLFWT